MFLLCYLLITSLYHKYARFLNMLLIYINSIQDRSFSRLVRFFFAFFFPAQQPDLKIIFGPKPLLIPNTAYREKTILPLLTPKL